MTALSAKKFYPVIHCVDPDHQQGIGHALANVRIATENGADGVFLIGHGISSQALCVIYEQVRKQFPDTWIGINFLRISPVTSWNGLVSVARNCIGLNALWTDGLPTFRDGLPETISLFGGIAFKYVNPRSSGENLKKECEEAGKVLDVATTSGDKTGEAPLVSKLEFIRVYLPNYIPLALASGVSTENVSSFLPFVHTFLVATSIIEINKNAGWHEYLIPSKVRELADIIHGK